jgi:hypothetical protein
MTDYTKTTNFTAKDSLPSGNAAKKILGSLFDTEFDAISTAIASKSDASDTSYTSTLSTVLINSTIDDASNNSVTPIINLTHTTSGTPGTGIGTAVDFIAETSASNNETGMRIAAVTTDVTPGSEDFDFVVNLMAAGSAAAEKLRVTSAGVLSTTEVAVTTVTASGNITVSGTVDGRDVATDGTKLDGIEAAADVTDATNVAAAGAVMESDTTTAAMSFVIDEDAMGSDSATKVPTQQSTKAYVDAQLIAANSLSGALLVGNSTGGTDVVVTAGDVITTDTINETTAAAGVTIDSVLLKDNTVTATTFSGALTGIASGNLVSGGALGTPSSGTLTNATGLPAAGVVGTAAVLGANTFTGTQNFADNILQRANLQDYGEVTNAIGSTGGGTQDIDLTLGNSVSLTVDTSANTFTFSNPTASDEMCGFILYITNGASQTVTWPASVDWPSATAPTLSASGLDILVFTTIDGGTTWHGQVAALLSS